MGIAGIFVGHVHQDIGRRVAGIGVEDEVDLDPCRVLDDGDRVVVDALQKLETQRLVEFHGAVEVVDSDADIVDPFDGDLAHGLLPGFPEK